MHALLIIWPTAVSSTRVEPLSVSHLRGSVVHHQRAGGAHSLRAARGPHHSPGVSWCGFSGRGTRGSHRRLSPSHSCPRQAVPQWPQSALLLLLATSPFSLCRHAGVIRREVTSTWGGGTLFWVVGGGRRRLTRLDLAVEVLCVPAVSASQWRFNVGPASQTLDQH